MRTPLACLAALSIAVLLTTPLAASPWAVVTNINDRTIHTLDLATDPPTAHGPFLAGQLGASGQISDIALVPGGPYALITNYNTYTVYRIDLRDPASPTLVDSLTLGTFTPVDIEVAPNGQFALLTDGRSLGVGNPAPTNQIASINPITMTLNTIYTLPTIGGTAGGAQGIAIAPDNQTVIVCDRYYGRIIFGVFNPATGFTSTTALATGAFPINVSIDPDGQTVVIGSQSTTVDVFQITAPGVVAARTGVAGLPGRQQAFAFSPDGRKAYTVSSNGSPTNHQFSWLQVLSPGNVTLGGAAVATFSTYGTDRWLGVETIGVTPDGGRAIVGNPLQSTASGTVINGVWVVSLSTFSFAQLTTSALWPVGVAIRFTAEDRAIPAASHVGLTVLALLIGVAAVVALRRLLT
jgi:hypothetical protein